jgi:hypothetical protein
VYVNAFGYLPPIFRGIPMSTILAKKKKKGASPPSPRLFDTYFWVGGEKCKSLGFAMRSALEWFASF